ncbi:hypothetical protein N7509_005319 [Penicillium cosmopolitanum]|uniref:PAP-associated domain-containing protein n=1 Tax=Penicillium cosmopolitanum TaxID=1131564 RepID=A0A9W9W290_9EURO|nr:uncharacterized protein N7509_005319 [Penicillium cosmopolitanum]KAJ5397206.1 hypothetical protein N7509_005319 [Penicillium cosmopolitanum]
MRLSALRSSRIALQTPRQLRASVSSPQDSDVFANNLRKTLDAHRTSNRNRLIRKVYPRSPAAGLWRPEIPLESRPEGSPATPPAPTVKEAKPKETTSRQRRRLRHEDSASRSTQSRLADTLIRSSETLHDGSAGNHPWLNYLGPSGGIDNATTFLNAEILALERYLSPSSPEQSWTDQLSAQVIGLLNPIVPHTPQLIGSRQVGLALPHSDLNFLLPFEDLLRSPDRARKPSATRPQIHDAHLRLLRRVKSTLESSPSFDQIQLSGKRRFILEARHHPTGLLLRFHCGERAPELMDYLKNYLAQYPTLRPLYMATRALLEARGLFGYSQSGIRPDALAMLLVAFLKLNQSRFSVPFNVGEQFLTFLKFYGTDVDLQSTGIAVDPPGFFGFEKIHDSEQGNTNTACLRGQRSLINAKRTAVSRGNMPAGQRLCIQDPTHYMNDLGRSCTRTAELQNIFSTAYKQLCDSSQDWKDTDKVDSILASALRANFDQLETLRESLVPSD